MSAETIIAEIIDAARALATTTSEAAIGYADDAQTAAQSILVLGPVPSTDRPNPELPPFSPQTDSNAEIRGGFDEMFGQLYPDFDTRFNTFLTRFFPKVETEMGSVVSQWICDTINNGGTGIPAAIEQQIWERSRARELLDADRQSEATIENFAERGFSLPPGALFGALQDVQFQLSQKISTHSREVAVENLKIEIENIRIAINKGIELRKIAIDAATDYLRAWSDTYKSSIDYANALVNAKMRLYDSTSGYYNALVAAARLDFDWGRANAEQELTQQGLLTSSSNQTTQGRVNAAISAAQTMGSLSAAVSSAQNTMANISNNTNISQDS